MCALESLLLGLFAITSAEATQLTGLPQVEVTTFAELREALDRRTGSLGTLRLVLPEGARFDWERCAQLRIHVTTVALRSEGAGAILDARGCTRHFDVAFGGTLQ